MGGLAIIDRVGSLRCLYQLWLFGCILEWSWSDWHKQSPKWINCEWLVSRHHHQHQEITDHLHHYTFIDAHHEPQWFVRDAPHPHHSHRTDVYQLMLHLGFDDRYSHLFVVGHNKHDRLFIQEPLIYSSNHPEVNTLHNILLCVPYGSSECIIELHGLNDVGNSLSIQHHWCLPEDQSSSHQLDGSPATPRNVYQWNEFHGTKLECSYSLQLGLPTQLEEFYASNSHIHLLGVHELPQHHPIQCT